jgi:diguanylate cyclase (GGDEF)-like protein
MKFKHFLVYIFSIYVVFIMISSVLMEKAYNTPLLIIFGALFMISIISEKRYPRSRYMQILLLGLFHWYSQLNWCMPLYILLAVKQFYNISKLSKSVLISLLFGTLYTSIRLSYSPMTLYSALVSISDFISFFVVGMMLYYLINSENEKKLLNEEKDHLLKHDSLTGLINFDECHKQMEVLLKGKRRFGLFLIDCSDLKSINMKLGIQGGNELLKKMADSLKDKFKEALIIARYGGDEFVLAVKVKEGEDTMSVVSEYLDTDLVELLGVHLAYGCAIYPKDGSTKDDLIPVAEGKLFEMKREMWLAREEHLLRSEKLRMIGELAAGMAHEIRNPLTTVKGFLQMSKASNYNVERWYELLMGEITRVSELTAEFLQFSKPQANQLIRHSLEECVQRVIYLVESEVIAQGHQLKYQTDHSDLYCLVDKDKLVQMLLNLVKNAIEAMGENGIVTLHLYQDQSYGIIEVQDTGCGISESNLQQLFHPFFTTKESGTGLGLAICHKIIQDHGGKIEVESTVNEGTVFRVYLPLVDI